MELVDEFDSRIQEEISRGIGAVDIDRWDKLNNNNKKKEWVYLI